MKRICVLLISSFIALTVSAQKSVTKFLGIPVDGFKSEMKQKLIAKGFEYNSYSDDFSGEFNGVEVYLSIVTNNNKVWRITVVDKVELNETDIKIRFNKLWSQFMRNEKYLPAGGEDFSIPQDEDISYNILVNKKRYEACFYQLDKTKDDIKEEITQKLLEKYTLEEINNPPKKKEKEISDFATIEGAKVASEAMDLNKSVWFMINEKYGKYRIVMYYDNEYNHSDGEDL